MAPVGVVLAGGAGRRMGGAKATALLAGRPLVAWAVEALRAGGLDEVAVAAKASTVLPALDVPVWLATSVTDYRQLPSYCDSGLGGRAADMTQYVAYDGRQLVDVDVLCQQAIPAVVNEFAAGRD